MKSRILIVALIAIAMGLNSSQAPAQTSLLYSAKWNLVELNGRKIKNSAAFIEFNGDTKQISGNATCNRFFGSFELSGRRFHSSGVGTTKRMCLGLKMTQTETSFLKALDDSDRLEIKGGLLTFSKGKAILMRFERSKTVDDRANADGLTAHKWILKRIGDKEVSLGNDVPFLNFDREKRSAGGNSGCNVFGGSYKVDGTSINFSQMIATMRACEADDRMAIERGFLDGLRNADRYEIKGDRLLIGTAGDTLLEFEAADK